jgi:hypothetical protein
MLLSTNRVTCSVLLCAILSLFSGSAPAASAAQSLCDIEVDPRMNLYKVMANGKPFKGKRYLTWDDALLLRNVLVTSGVCKRVAPAKFCEVQLLTAGAYAVMRDGVNFDPIEKLRTLGAAHKYAKRLAKVKLCKPIK